MMHLIQEPHFWSGVAFFLFFLIFGKKIWVSLTTILDDRASAIRSKVEESNRLRQEAEIMLEDAKKAYAQASLDARQTLESAQLEAARLSQQASESLALLIAKREKIALDAIDYTYRKAMMDIQNIVADIATQASVCIIRDVVDEKEKNRILEESIDALPQTFTSRHA